MISWLFSTERRIQWLEGGRQRKMRINIFIGFILSVFLLTLSSARLDEWSIRIGVRSDRSRDSYNFMGVSREASLFYDEKDIPEPPPSLSGLCLYFPHYDWSFNPGRYATDIRNPIINAETYEFVVESGGNNKLILFWSDIVNAPGIYGFTLIDEGRGISIDMRELTEYAFDCSPGGKNMFRVLVKRRKRITGT